MVDSSPSDVSIGKVRLGKVRLVEDSIDSSADAPFSAKEKRFVKPTIEEIKAYCAESGITIDSDALYDYYESNGWHVGNKKMKDWKATVRNWERRDKERHSGYKKPDKPKKETSFDLDEYENMVDNFTPVYKKEG